MKQLNENIEVKFYENVEDNLLNFAVIVSKSNGKWVFCKHKDRTTYECPGGHREKNETILQTAERELTEETGASEFYIKPVCVYSVTGKTRVNELGEESYGMLYYADIKSFDYGLHSEIQKVELFDELPEKWTYPKIQPLLLEEVQKRMQETDFYSMCRKTSCFSYGECQGTKRDRNQADNEFWHVLDELVSGSEIIIDRPKGTTHPRFSHMVYPVDYGYLQNTESMDGAEIDVWVGTKEDKNIDAIICTVDLMKKDSEIKILIGCTEEEKELIYKVHNESQYMKGVLIRRSIL